MSDVFTRQKRSLIMAANRGSGNRSTEVKLRVRLAAHKISGWRINGKDIYGKPDFVFDRERLAVFVDGCFWHGCKTCRNIPATNRKFWAKKIEGNKQRDKAVTRKLRRNGWAVIRFWEHQVRREPQRCIQQIQSTLAERQTSVANQRAA
jgi:DNA mismatch endonuclease (patch repair protein)